MPVSNLHQLGSASSRFFKLALIALSFSVLVSADSIHAQLPTYSKSELRKEFFRGLRNERALRTKVAELGLGKEKTEVMLNYYSSLVRDEAVANRIFEEVAATGIFDELERNPSAVLNDPKRAELLGYALFEMLGVRGMRRLDYQDLRVYLRSVGVLFDSLPPRVCKALIVGEISDHRELEAASSFLMKRMTLQELDSYLRVYRRAVVAEVRDFPAARELNANQKRIADEALMAAFMKRLNNHSRGARLALALADQSKASDSDFCEAGQVMITTLLDMSGAVAEWAARGFVDSIQ